MSHLRSVGSLQPVIVIHGGAGLCAREHFEAALAGVRTAAEIGRALLMDGHSAERAVVEAVRSMEDDPAFNAGRGSCMNAEGRFEMDAGIMRSVDMRVGAVAAVPEIRDPILLARAVMNDSRHCLLVGEGAVRFAWSRGIGTFGREEVWTEKAQRRFEEANAGLSQRDGQADTVGAVALDRNGHFAAACSTGGVLLKSPGRVGDSPLVGSGFYAAPDLGASCATGMGEAILTHVAAYEVLRRIAAGDDPDDAAWAVCTLVAERWNATCGLIVITPDGRPAVAHRSEHMSWAIARGDREIEAGLDVPRPG